MTPELGHIDAVVFDLDGTLIDSASDIAHAINATLASVGLQPVDLATVQGWIGNGPNALIASALKARGADSTDLALCERLHQRFIEASHAAPFDHGTVYPGVIEALRRLHGQLPLAVVTNKPTPLAQAVIEAAGLQPYLLHVQGADSAAQRKPLPLTLQSTAQALGVPVARVLMVGDAPPDVLAAQAAGCAAALVSWGYGAHAVAPQLQPWRLDHPGQLTDGLHAAGRLPRAAR
jgi:phosphoglycolate phosphatase